MAFIRKDGKTKLMYLPVTTSTVMSTGSAVTFASGLLVLATSASTTIAGILRKTISSTDSDYATARNVPVEVPVENFVEWEADTSGAVTTDIGHSFDLTDSKTLNRGAQSVKVFTVTQYISATKLRGIFNALTQFLASS